MASLRVWPGTPYPLGASWDGEGTNFALFSEHATGVELCLYGRPEDAEESHRIDVVERTDLIWHAYLPDVRPGQLYGYRVHGPYEPEQGHRFNPNKLVLDPYAKAVTGQPRWDDSLFGYRVGDADADLSFDARSSAGDMPKCAVVDPAFPWGDDRHPAVPWNRSVIYECHVRGLTMLHPGVPPELRGTYLGMASDPIIDHLLSLGVTAVELMPVHQFINDRVLVERGLTNYWGYNSIAFHAPHNGYSASGDRGQQVTEFKEMVKAFHAAGLEVFLDVVYNHTAEGGVDGPTLSFRGLDDRGFYHRVDHREPGDPFDDTYWDITGCGNTVNSSDPFALRLVLDSLRYWTSQMRVDGFRFDLASALSRSGHHVDMTSPLMLAIGQDPTLRHVKLIAEPWDASMDGYRLGEFPPPWVEWNDQYRDTIRDFWRGQGDGIHRVATRLAGSSDLYADDGRSPYNSVNFVTAHDGFTLRDLVSYNEKHNEANGEDNRDGSDNNRSWNCGVEGETDDPDVLALRHRQAANLLATLCVSNGVPMITAGDERGRTQRGNNNAYAQDNETSWLDWRPDDAWLDLYELTRAALRIRREHPALRQRHWFDGQPTVEGGPKDLAWVHPSGREMRPADWADPGQRVLGMFVSGDPLRAPGPRGEQQRDSSFLLWLNGSPTDAEVDLPVNEWVRSGEVVLSTDEDLQVGKRLEAGQAFTLAARSLVLLRDG